jgi:hypothetical protein
MKPSLMERQTLLVSLVLLILLSLFAAIPTSIALASELSMTQTRLLQAGGFLMSAAVALGIMARSKFSFQEYGLAWPGGTKTAGVLAFLPLLLAEAIKLPVGFDHTLSAPYTAVVLLFTVAAVMNEELYTGRHQDASGCWLFLRLLAHCCLPSRPGGGRDLPDGRSPSNSSANHYQT